MPWDFKQALIILSVGRLWLAFEMRLIDEIDADQRDRASKSLPGCGDFGQKGNCQQGGHNRLQDHGR